MFMKTFNEWLKESFIVGYSCGEHEDYQVAGAQSDARGGKGCPNAPGSKIPLITTGKPPTKKNKKHS